jgi:hypothetical protein
MFKTAGDETAPPHKMFRYQAIRNPMNSVHRILLYLHPALLFAL